MAGIGLIGLGVMGSRMLEQINRHPQLHAVVAWDPGEAASRRAAITQPGLISADSALEVAAHAGISCVYIASPPSSHLDYIGLACDHGKAVFCEKPLALDEAAAAAMVDRIEQKGMPAAMNFPHASAPAVRVLADDLTAGRLGDIQRVDVTIAFPQWPEAWQADATWLAARAEGGFVREVVTHMLFLARRLLGPMALNQATIAWPDDPAGAETGADISLTAGGVPVRIQGRIRADAAEVVHWTVTGTCGARRVVDWYGLEEMSGDGAWSSHPVLAPYDPMLARSDAGQAQLDGLKAMLNGEHHTMASMREGLDVQRIIEAALIREPGRLPKA